MGYYLVKGLSGGAGGKNGLGRTATADSEQIDETGGEDEGVSGALNSYRRFTQLDGSWLSYVEAGRRSSTQLLMLHRTALSAETEFGGVITQLASRDGPSSGLRVLAPDRFCHGYSPCINAGATDTALFKDLIGDVLSTQPVAYMSSGREAARQIISLVQSREVPAKILLFRPGTSDS